MSQTWQQVRDRMVEEYRKISVDCPQDIVKIFKYDIIDTKAGSFDTALTTQVFLAGEIRYLGSYAANRTVAIADLAGDKEVSVEALKSIYKILVPMSAEFSAYCGLSLVWDWDKEVQSVFDQITNREDFKSLVSAYANVVSACNGWILYYFPWNLGDARKQKSIEDIKEMAMLAGL
jgi:Glycerol-3-phosphate O-acyltransferase